MSPCPSGARTHGRPPSPRPKTTPIYIYINTHIHMCIQKYVYSCIYIYIFKYVSIYVCTYPQFTCTRPQLLTSLLISRPYRKLGSQPGLSDARSARMRPEDSSRTPSPSKARRDSRDSWFSAFGCLGNMGCWGSVCQYSPRAEPAKTLRSGEDRLLVASAGPPGVQDAMHTLLTKIIWLHAMQLYVRTMVQEFIDSLVKPPCFGCTRADLVLPAPLRTIPSNRASWGPTPQPQASRARLRKHRDFCGPFLPYLFISAF